MHKLATTVFRENKLYQMIWKVFLAAEFGFCMILFLYASLFSRAETAERRYELELFWSYKKAIELRNVFWYRQILYNILSFVPLGNALYYLSEEKIKFWKCFLLFGLSSLGIELIQLIFKLGLFEFDDIFDNLLGGLIGYSVAVLFAKLLHNKERN